MKKLSSKLLAVVLAALMLIVALPFAASAATNVNGKTFNVGETFTVTWTLETSTPVVNAEFAVKYPAEYLKVVERAESVDFPVLSKSGLIVKYGEGSVNAAATNIDDFYSFDGGATLVEIKFEVIANGTANVDLDVEYIGGKNPNGIKNDEIDLVDENGKLANGVKLTQTISGATAAETLNVNGKVNAEVGSYVVYDVVVKSDYKVNDIQGNVAYDSKYLELTTTTCPIISDMVYNDTQDGLVEFTATKPDAPYDFTKEGIVIRLVFLVLKGGSTEIVGTIQFMDGNDPDDVKKDVELIEDNKTLDKSTTLEFVINAQEKNPFIYGDVTKDGNVTSLDATVVLQYAAGIVEKDDPRYEYAAADVSGDGAVTSLDATYILQYAAGIIKTFPAEA